MPIGEVVKIAIVIFVEITTSRIGIFVYHRTLSIGESFEDTA